MSQAGISSIKNVVPGVVETITGNTGGAVGPDASNNINFTGNNLYTVTGTPASHSLTINPNPNAFPVTPYVVGPSGEAGYQTIQSGVNAANAAGGGIVYVQPGTYAENLTLFDNIQIVGCLGFSDTNTGAILIGIHTPPASGSFIFRNIKLQSATHIFNSAVAGSAHLIVADSAVAITNGYLYNLPNWTGILENYDLNCSFGTNDGFVNNTAGATILCYNASIGKGTGNTAIISGAIFSEGTFYSSPLNFVTGANFNFDGCQFANTVTLSNNSTGYFDACHFSTGANASVTMSSTSEVNITNSTITSSNNPAISGLGVGVLTLAGLDFTSNTSIANTLNISTSSGYFPSNYTSNSFLLGNGPQCLKTLGPLLNGQLPIGSTGGSPVANTLTPGAGISITNGAGSITISSNGLAISYVSVNNAASPYTVTTTDYYISCDPTGGAITIKLPNAPTNYRLFVVKDRTGKAATNNISITTVGGAVNIDGSATYTLSSNFESVQLLFNGTSYEVY